MIARPPTFFLVGAPRCGTTSFFDYLCQHPDVFRPPVKEPNVFGRDLRPPLDPAEAARDRARYEANYAGWTTEAAAGDGSTWALSSATAAAEIAEAAPGARVLVMVREPVQMLHSLYSLLASHQVTVPTGVLPLGPGPPLPFREALRTADARRAEVRRQLADGSYPLPIARVFHPDVAAYATQLERYLAAFGPERVHVIVHDDLAADARAVYRGALAFLGLDPTFEPAFAVRNANVRTRSYALKYALRGAGAAWVRRAAKAALPFVAWDRLSDRVSVMNAVRARRARVDERAAAEVRERLGGEVARLGELLGRDLAREWGYV